MPTGTIPPSSIHRTENHINILVPMGIIENVSRGEHPEEHEPSRYFTTTVLVTYFIPVHSFITTDRI